MSNTQHTDQFPVQRASTGYLLKSEHIWGIATMLFTALAVSVPVYLVTSKPFPIHGSFWNQPIADWMPLIAVQLAGGAAVLGAAFYELVRRAKVYPEHYALLTGSTLVLALLFTHGMENRLNSQPAPANLLAQWVEQADECAATRVKDSVRLGGVITGNDVLHIVQGCEQGRIQMNWNKAQRLALARY